MQEKELNSLPIGQYMKMAPVKSSVIQYWSLCFISPFPSGINQLDSAHYSED